VDLTDLNQMSPYRLMNRVMKGTKSKESLMKVRGLILLLLRSLRKLPRVMLDTTYRGVRQTSDSWNEGDIKVFWGFTSTSGDMSSTKDFSSGEHGRLLVIEGPVFGYDLKEFSRYPTESEILLEPETVIEITGKGKEDMVIQCKRIQMISPLLPVAPFRIDSGTVLYKNHPELLTDFSLEVSYLWRKNSYKKLCQLLKNNMIPTTEIKFAFSSDGNFFVNLLCDAVKTNVTLTSMNLDEFKLKGAGARRVFEALKRNNSITKLSLKSNSFGETGGKYIGHLLQINTTLTEVDLRHNAIGSKAAETFATALKINKSLIKLNLGDNKIHDAGAKKISSALLTNLKLSKINLSANGIRDGGAIALSEVLRMNKTLTELNLNENKISSKGATKIFETLRTNSTLKRLRIGGIKTATVTTTTDNTLKIK